MSEWSNDVAMWAAKLKEVERERDAALDDAKDEHHAATVLRAEVERLKELIDRWKVKAQQAERERDAWKARYEHEFAAASDLQAEVARLKAELEAWRIGQRKVELVVDLGEVGK